MNTKNKVPMDGVVENQESFGMKINSYWTAVQGYVPYGTPIACDGSTYVQKQIFINSADEEPVEPDPQYLSLQLFESTDFVLNGVNGTPVTTINEGDSPMVVLQTANVPVGTQVGFSLVMPPASSGFVSAEDFTNPNTGVPAVGTIMTIENNVASFQLDTIEDLLVEGNEIGFLVLTAVVVSENDDYRNSKAYKDLNETMLNRNENV